ncbi:MAG: adenosylhomocysteinase [Candidatus Bipolaricaulota bacterium]|nr:adenosylhomocysteinase [Candidatus Bipolaricaulota bacterium]
MEQELIRRGREKIEWARSWMPLLAEIRGGFIQDRPFSGRRVGVSIHLEAKTACLALLLRDGGAQVFVTGSNPLSTQDEVAAALAEEDGISVYARRGVNQEQYRDQLKRVLEKKPQLILDDGGDLTSLMHELGDTDGVLGGAEETTTGVTRLRVWRKQDRLRFPMFAVNDAKMKYLFDNRYGTGQSTWDAIMRSTNMLVAGKSVLVAGYGWCGRGIALRAHGLGARVSVAEVDPVRAVEAVMDGFKVAPLREAIGEADFVITATGCRDVVMKEALLHAKDGLLLANAGHFDVEIGKPALSSLASSRRTAREGIEEFTLNDGRRVYLLGEGRLVNLVLGDGHPIEIMDISFALQALTLRYLVENAPLAVDLYAVPPQVDDHVARMKLASLGVQIDSLSAEQREYLGLEPVDKVR